MGAVMLEKIIVTPLANIYTQGGNVLHAMKSSDAGFSGFGEAYFSWIKDGEVKAWKVHKSMTMNIVVPHGDVRFVFYCSDLKTYREENIGTNRYARLTIPPGLWFGFKGIGSLGQSLVLNLANIPHNPSEVERLEISKIKYDWSCA
jgi:dTDP-4-dehydrorhamnose 3,5-epimerase